jgi:hypothetical protein
MQKHTEKELGMGFFFECVCCAACKLLVFDFLLTGFFVYQRSFFSKGFQCALFVDMFLP